MCKRTEDLIKIIFFEIIFNEIALVVHSSMLQNFHDLLCKCEIIEICKKIVVAKGKTRFIIIKNKK